MAGALPACGSDGGELLARLRTGGLLPAGRDVLVLLSGGRDSVCLLDAAVLLAGVGHVRALHVNYGLRDEASADEDACVELCERLGVELRVERPGAPPRAGNLQAWARDLRYGAGTRLAAAVGARLAAGHTITDQAETVLYRLAASPGRRALLGMEDERGLLVRPLLRAGLSREDTADWCRARGLDWREDLTNESPGFARGRVRARAMPALRELHPAAETNLLRTVALLREEAAVLDELVETVLGDRREIGVEHLAALPPALARLVVRRLAEDAAGRLCARAPGRLDELLGLARADGRPAALDLGDGARAVVERGALRFERGGPAPIRPQ